MANFGEEIGIFWCNEEEDYWGEATFEELVAIN